MAVETDGMVGVPAEGAVLAGVGSVVHVVDALGRRGVGRAGKLRLRKILVSETDSVSRAESSPLTKRLFTSERSAKFRPKKFSYLPEARLSAAPGIPAAPMASMKELQQENVVNDYDL